ncbi:MAG: hypothetical protein JJ957_17585 [Pseudomonadales bacterium]|nr:hypothetical protein [Pseudomonadales bacterium]MBO6597408.1 hypothetical protein [Pseudomonadales bacterium]MBO6824142.1 hypothetical protein [Pseudomonadales bacterium]
MSCWPWRYAYATGDKTNRSCDSSRQSFYETRWHRQSGRSFGVRRPLRYLAHHLDLNESQTRRMASVLNTLKTEREQAELDEKRTVTALASLLEEGTPTLAEARKVLKARVDSADQLKEETAKALVAISDFLDQDQREEFINLLLTGSVSL